MLRNALHLYAVLVLAVVSPLSAQDFKVQIGAFDEPVELDYYPNLGIPRVYQSIDQMGIYHYFVGAYSSREEADKIVYQLQQKGFTGATVYDSDAQKNLCGVPCPYFIDGSIYFDENTSVLALRSVYFDFGKSTIDSKGLTTLREVKKMLDETPGSKLKIFGYTDTKVSPANSIEIATRRARAARNEMVNLGIHHDRIYLKVMGTLDQVVANSGTGKDNQQIGRENRRVVLAVLMPNGEIKTNKTVFNSD